ncbi:MAG: hypothetical protein GY827_12560 [Cytophagales bacterium]|nr:hypothetical protein [Cytophagales bacterium]
MKDVFGQKRLAFWKNWNKQDKALYLFSLILLGVSIILFMASYHLGLDLLIDWKVLNETKGINTTLDEFQRNLNNYTLEVQTYFVNQYFEAGNLRINTLGAKIYLLFIAFSASLIIAAISSMRKILWFSLSMSLVVAWLAFMKFDTLGILGYTNNAFLIVSLVLYIGVSFLFHAYKTEISILYRFLVFLGITLGLGTVALTTSTLSHPYIHLTNYGNIVNSIASLIFIVMVGYDLVNGFFTLSLQGQGNSLKALISFGVLSLLYLSNLLLVFLNQIGYISWDLNFFNPFYLFLGATFLGIWAHRRRSTMIQETIPFHSEGALLYIGLAINAIATFTYAFATTNNPMISVFNDAVSYSFLCLGGVFVIYVVLNFFAPLQKGLDVYEYIYEPKIVGHFFVRVAGIGLVFTLLAKHSYEPVKQWMGAYYNYVADIYTVNNETNLAKYNYKLSNQYSPLNHKANYTLASIAMKEDNLQEAQEYLNRLALGKTISESGFINLSNIYEKNGKVFKSIFTLQRGVKQYPESGIINHALAYAFQKHYKNQIDSVYYYYNRASKYLDDPNIAQSNLITLYGEHQIPVSLDSLKKMQKVETDLMTNNFLALSSIQGQENRFDLSKQTWKNDSIATGEVSCILYNYAFSRLGKGDSTLKNTLTRFVAHPESAYSENLKFALACLHYYDHEVDKSKKLLDDVLVSCTNELYPYYSNFLGTLLYKKYLSELAVDYFEKSTQAQRFFVINSAPSHYAFASAENSEIQDLSFTFQLLSIMDTTSKSVVAQLKPIFENPSLDSVAKWTDKQKFQYLIYHPNTKYDSINTNKILNSFEDAQAKAQTCTVLLDQLLDKNEKELAENVWAQIPQIELYPRILKEVNYQYLRLLALQYKFNELSDRLENIKLSEERKLNYYYLKGIAFEALGDTTNAKIAFEANLKIQPLLDLSYVKYAQYLEEVEAYNFLVKASYRLPNSAHLHKSLALYAVNMNMDAHAQFSYDRLETLLSKKEFEKFSAIYERSKAEAEKRFNEEWE